MRVLSGIQPSGNLHLGNYFGMMKKMIEHQENEELFCFIANYHAMTSVNDGKALAKGTLEAAVNFLALGMDPEKSTFWVQSDLSEVQELSFALFRDASVILASLAPVGLFLSLTHERPDATGLHEFQDYWRTNPVRYKYYRWGSGRDAFLDRAWGKDSR